MHKKENWFLFSALWCSSAQLFRLYCLGNGKNVWHVKSLLQESAKGSLAKQMQEDI